MLSCTKATVFILCPDSKAVKACRGFSRFRGFTRARLEAAKAVIDPRGK
jgi:hypothetical protein